MNVIWKELCMLVLWMIFISIFAKELELRTDIFSVFQFHAQGNFVARQRLCTLPVFYIENRLKVWSRRAFIFNFYSVKTNKFTQIECHIKIIPWNIRAIPFNSMNEKKQSCKVCWLHDLSSLHLFSRRRKKTNVNRR